MAGLDEHPAQRSLCKNPISRVISDLTALHLVPRSSPPMPARRRCPACRCCWLRCSGAEPSPAHEPSMCPHAAGSPAARSLVSLRSSCSFRTADHHRRGLDVAPDISLVSFGRTLDAALHLVGRDSLALSDAFASVTLEPRTAPILTTNHQQESGIRTSVGLRSDSMSQILYPET